MIIGYSTISFGCLCAVAVLIRWTIMTFLFPKHRPLQLPNIVFLTLLKLSQILHDIVFEPLSIISDFEDKSQYYFPYVLYI